jgi:hypothetical protein
MIIPLIVVVLYTLLSTLCSSFNMIFLYIENVKNAGMMGESRPSSRPLPPPSRPLPSLPPLSSVKGKTTPAKKLPYW